MYQHRPAAHSPALDGFEFLTMAEWALPIQERHLAVARESSLALAGQEDPQAPGSD